MKTYLKPIILASFAFCTLIAQSQEVIKVATTGKTLPMTFKDESGLFMGLDVELISRIAELEGLKPEFMQAQWADLFKGVEEKRFDIAVAGISYTDERNEKYALSEPYLLNPASILVTQKHSEVQALADLAPLRVGIMKGSKHKQALEAVGVQNVQEISGTFPLFKTLAQGKVDAILHDRIILEYLSIAYANDKLKFRVVPYEAESEPSAKLVVVMAKGNSALQEKVNHGIKQLQENGELDKIKDKWLNFKEETK